MNKIRRKNLQSIINQLEELKSSLEELAEEEGAFTLLETLLGTEATASVTVTSKVTVFSPYLTIMV